MPILSDNKNQILYFNQSIGFSYTHNTPIDGLFLGTRHILYSVWSQSPYLIINLSVLIPIKYYKPVPSFKVSIVY